MAARPGGQKSVQRSVPNRKTTPLNKKNILINKRLGQKNNQTNKIVKGDARLKIIQKNRNKLVDARDKLAQMAKTKDAREKLLKLREARITGKKVLNESIVRPVGSNITLKKDRNGKISLSTNKSNRTALTTPMSLGLAVQKQLGLISTNQTTVTNRRQVQRKPISLRQPTSTPIRGGPRNLNYQVPAAALRVDGYDRDISMEEAYTPAPPPVIRRTIHNDIVAELPPLPTFSRTPESALYGWGPSTSVRAPIEEPDYDVRRKKAMKIITRNEIADSVIDDWRAPARSMPRTAYIDLDAVEDPHPPRPLIKPSTGIRARLDTPVAARQSHGIFAQTKPKAVVSPGHRIVVSNLHPTVSQEDITELFADVGELMVARLVRPGTAEVIYKNLTDAEKAVEVYHNRQLDGQPMNCLLVNRRPSNNPTAPALTKSSTTSTLRTSSSGAIKKPTSILKSSSSKLVPDLSTIHKVLFNRS